MPLDREERSARAPQVGVLLRWHRQNFNRADGRQGLSQSDVLGLMAPLSVDEKVVPADSSSWSRMENGVSPPTRERLEVFGLALNLSEEEINGLLALAGFETARQPQALSADRRRAKARAAVDSNESDPSAEAEADGPDSVGVFGERGVRVYVAEALDFSFFRFLLPAAAMAGAGYLLFSLGVTAVWILMLYVGLAMGLVLSQGFFKMRRAGNLRELLFVTLFIVLSAGLLQVPFIGMDPYGFYIWGEPGGIVLPIVLSLMANLAVSLVASLIFDLLWRWQYSGRGADKAYLRALWVVAPPMGFTYSWILLTGNWGAWVGCSVILTILTGVFAMLTVMRDETVVFTEWDRRFLLWCSVQVTTVLAALGAVSIVVGYMDPSLLSLSGHTLIHPWEINYTALGYSESELIPRLRVGYLWNSMTCISYLVIFIGGYLTLNIYRLGGGDPAVPTADVGELPAGETAKPDTVGKRIKSLFGPGRLAGHPLRPEPA